MSFIPWEKYAKDLGFRDEKEMWVRLYAKYSIPQLAARFATSQGAIRAQLRAHEIASRSPGGPNNQKVDLTEDLLILIKERGIASVAHEQGLDPTTLYKALKRKGLTTRKLKQLWQEDHPATPESQDAEGSSGPSENPQNPAQQSQPDKVSS